MDRIARAEAEQDPQKRVKIAHDFLRGMRGPQEKLAFVAIDDDPEKGFVYEAARKYGKRQPT